MEILLNSEALFMISRMNLQQYSMSYQHNRQNNLTRKIQFFKNSIRRQQIDFYFNQSRKKLIESRSLNHNDNSLQQSLNTQYGKIEYLTNQVRSLNQKPVHKWHDHISELSASLKYFSGKFNLWIECKIIEKLSQALTIEHSECQIHHLVAELFSSIILLASPKQCRSNAYIIESLIANKIVTLLKTTNYPPEQKIQFIIFFASLCSLSATIRQTILESGGGQILVQFGNQILQPIHFDEQIISRYIYSCLPCLKIFNYKNQSYFPQANFTLNITPIIIKILQFRINQKIIKNAIICLLNMIKQNKQVIYDAILRKNQHIYSLLFEIVDTVTNQTKEQIFNIFSWVVYQLPNQSIKILWSLKIFDLIERNISTVSPSLNFVIISVNIISNMIRNQQQAINFTNHYLFQKLLAFLKLPQEKIKQTILDCLIIISQSLQYPEINNLITKNKLLPRLITQISHLKPSSTPTVLNCLFLLEIYIISNKKQHTDFNAALFYLQKHYDFQKTLMNIFNDSSLQGPKGQQVRTRSGRILDFMSECVYEEPL